MDAVVKSRPRLQLFGSPRAVGPEGRTLALPARAYLLVVYIVTAGRDFEVTRSQLASFLWPDAQDASANLRQLLGRLSAAQSQAGFNLFRFDRSTVALNLDDVSVDLVGFQASLRGLSWANCQEVLESFRGDLLEGIVVRESDLAIWLDVQRARVRESFVTAYAGLLDAPDARANPRTAQDVASRLLEIDPYQESAYRSLMRSFAASGQFELVTATFENCRTVLRRDLGSTPSRDTIALFNTLTCSQRHGAVDRAGPGNLAGTGVAAVGEHRLRGMIPRLVVLAPPRGDVETAVWEISTLILDDTIIRLCSLKTVAVVAPHTSWQLSGGALDDDTEKRFDIGYVLETNLRRRHGVDLLVVKLFDTRTRVIVWADTYTLSIDSFAGTHQALATSITLSLADAVERAEIARFEKEQNPQAYYWHLIGQKHLRYMDLPNVRRALKAFRSSVAADPGFAPAHSGSARATQRQWLVLGRGDPDLLDEAEQSGAKAISLDHRDARGYREIGLCSLYRRRWDEAVANFAEAENLDPQHADLISDFGDALGHCGEPEKGLKKVERAMELNPIPPDQYWWNAAGLHFQLRNYEAAIDAIERMGDPLPALRIAAASWAYLGDVKHANRSAAKFLRSYPDFRIEQWLSIVPDRNPDDHRHYDHGLRLAGFR